MSKQLISQKYIYKIHSTRLKENNYELTLSIEQARKNQELISLAESQMMRFIDSLNNHTNVEITIKEIKEKINVLRNSKASKLNTLEMRQLHKQLDELLFKKDYVNVVIDNISHYDHMFDNGFIINGIKFRRLLGTTGGIKASTIVFVNENLLPALKEKIANGRNLKNEFTPAKLEAYQSLTCSASTPVSMPKGVCVVDDCITKFKEDYILLDDTFKGAKQPRMIFKKDSEIELIDSDGMGLGMPSLMQRWSNDMEIDYMMSGCVIRNSFCKGAVLNVDFREFAKDNNVSEIKDVWGYTHKVEDIELILTTSMLKLWDSYSSIDDYLNNCKKNGYTFAITKVCVKELESERNMNYQYLQNYNFSDNELDELLNPTINMIKDIKSGDSNKTVLYLAGIGLNAKNIKDYNNSFVKALMIDERMKDDPFIKSTVNKMIKKKIQDAKIGTISCHAHYSLVSGDVYSLCQSMFGLEVTGILNKGEIYNEYWVKNNIDEVALFRSPMSVFNNIRKVKVNNSEKAKKFYRYMHSVTVLNSWDSICHAMNGMDKD